MSRIIVLSLFLIFGFISCKTAEKEVDKLEIAKKYYKFLDTSDSAGMITLLGDSIVIRENEDDYVERFSQKGYIKWLEWDSVFGPTYKILEIEQEGEIVKARISKIDKRIFFLHEEPMIWNEVIRFKNNKINSIERVEYEVFDVMRFLKNRVILVSWIDENHPELNGFLHDQTKSGGKKYLKALELFKNR